MLNGTGDNSENETNHVTQENNERYNNKHNVNTNKNSSHNNTTNNANSYIGNISNGCNGINNIVNSLPSASCQSTNRNSLPGTSKAGNGLNTLKKNHYNYENNSSSDEEEDNHYIYTYKGGDNMADLPSSFYNLNIPKAEDRLRHYSSSEEMDYLEMDFNVPSSDDEGQTSSSASTSRRIPISLMNKTVDKVNVINNTLISENNNQQNTCKLNGSLPRKKFKRENTCEINSHNCNISNTDHHHNDGDYHDNISNHNNDTHTDVENDGCNGTSNILSNNEESIPQSVPNDNSGNYNHNSSCDNDDIAASIDNNNDNVNNDNVDNDNINHTNNHGDVNNDDDDDVHNAGNNSDDNRNDTNSIDNNDDVGSDDTDNNDVVDSDDIDCIDNLDSSDEDDNGYIFARIASTCSSALMNNEIHIQNNEELMKNKSNESFLTQCVNTVELWPDDIFVIFPNSFRFRIQEDTSHSILSVFTMLETMKYHYSMDTLLDTVQSIIYKGDSTFFGYLVERFNNGTDMNQLAYIICEVSNGCLYTKFFSTYPERKFYLSEWLSQWMGKGVIPIITRNIQAEGHITRREILKNPWVHHMVYKVDERGIYLSEPFEFIEEQALRSQLSKSSVIYIKQQSIIHRWSSQVDLRNIAAVDNQYWQDINVLGQVVNTIRTWHNNVGMSTRQNNQYIKIPSHVQCGITLVVSKNSPFYNEVLEYPQLPILECLQVKN